MVSAEGGGILASGWATQVMTGIVEQLEESSASRSSEMIEYTVTA